METQINAFAKEVTEKETLDLGFLNNPAWKGYTRVIMGKKFAKVDVAHEMFEREDKAWGGKYMIALEDIVSKWTSYKKGEIVGIKAYGVPNPVRRYGNVLTGWKGA